VISGETNAADLLDFVMKAVVLVPEKHVPHDRPGEPARLPSTSSRARSRSAQLAERNAR